MPINLAGVEGRCLNCKTAMKPDRDDCPKCGDRVRPKITPKFTALEKEARKLFTIAPAVELSDEQRKALKVISRWFEEDPSEPFYLTGAAGTGKTTLAREIANMLGRTDRQGLGIEPVYGAYTGKAAHVLRRKGMPATTIHSAIYEPTSNYELRAELLAVQDEIAEWKSGPGPRGMEKMHRLSLPELEAEEESLLRQIKRPAFRFNPNSEWAHADLIVLDEVSMVNKAIAEDVLSFGVPVLVLGDPYQLPPIEGGGHFTQRDADFELKQVHRQALESPVYALATAVRQGQPWKTVPVDLAEAMAADQILVWKNATRWRLIEVIRSKLGRPKGEPVPGDRIMCLVNNREAAIFNGAQFEVLSVQNWDTSWELLVRDDEGLERKLHAYPDGFQGLASETEGKSGRHAYRGPIGLFTFANAITVHKAQGSEWDSVYLVDQTAQMGRSTEQDRRRWLYTGCSRASKSITIAVR